jgi:hypothetical protein
LASSSKNRDDVVVMDHAPSAPTIRYGSAAIQGHLLDREGLGRQVQPP